MATKKKSTPGKEARSNQPRVPVKRLEEDQYRKYIKSTKIASKSAKTTKEKVSQKRAEATARDYEGRHPGIAVREPYVPKGYKAPSKKTMSRDEFHMAFEVAGQPAKTKKEKQIRNRAIRDLAIMQAKNPGIVEKYEGSYTKGKIPGIKKYNQKQKQRAEKLKSRNRNK